MENIQVKSGKLTKRFLMDLPEGLFLVSNIGFDRFNPGFAEDLSPPSLRMEQWERIVKAGTDQRLCHIFRTKA